MAQDKPNIMLVDDEPNILKTMTLCLRELDLKITSFSNPQQAEKAIADEYYDIAFLDLKMSPVNGLELLKKIKRSSPQTTVVIVTAHGSIDSAVEAMKNGAFDYLQKPFDCMELQLLTQKALEFHRLKIEVQDLKKQLREQQGSGNIITRNERMREMVLLAKRVADSDLSVLIEGESGTGKELFADLIQQNSPRSGKPFIKINCAAVPENLLESELFGHVRGAFTGALKDRKGRFELASGGTIFLDEIAEISTALQAKLLRVLQTSEFERVGESISRKTDVRIIASTNKNLDEALKEGAFREDLFYRLNGVRIKLTPLRERPEDIPLLVQYFLKKFSADYKQEIDPEALGYLSSYRWNGNVREMENVLRRAILLAQGEQIGPDCFPEEIRTVSQKPQQLFTLEEMEKTHIKKVLQYAADYNDAARLLGIDPATLWRKRKRFRL